MGFTTVNPMDGACIQSHQYESAAVVEKKILSAYHAQINWEKLPILDRLQSILNVERSLLENQNELAHAITSEMGKPIREAKAEIEKSARLCRYYFENALELLPEFNYSFGKRTAQVVFQPIGVVLGIMPWNFPVWQVIRFTIPTLLMGNAVLLKHAPNVTQTALLLADLVSQGLAEANLYQSLVVDIVQVESILAHENVQGVSLTGSTRAGRAVAELAGRYLKKCVLELGGNDAAVVLDDANLIDAAKKIVASRLMNSGQSCIATKRVIASEKIYDDIKGLILSEMMKYQLGNPLLQETTVGPLARKDLRQHLEQQVTQMESQGAKILYQSSVPKEGEYYPITLIENSAAVLSDQELFGPVLQIIKANSEAEAIDVANETPFGLGASIYTGDIERGRSLAQNQLHVGSCFVNEFVKSQPELPFGGTKQSGYGRELGLFGLLEFTNIKTVVWS